MIRKLNGTRNTNYKVPQDRYLVVCGLSLIPALILAATIGVLVRTFSRGGQPNPPPAADDHVRTPQEETKGDGNPSHEPSGNTDAQAPGSGDVVEGNVGQQPIGGKTNSLERAHVSKEAPRKSLQTAETRDVVRRPQYSLPPADVPSSSSPPVKPRSSTAVKRWSTNDKYMIVEFFEGPPQFIALNASQANRQK